MQVMRCPPILGDTYPSDATGETGSFCGMGHKLGCPFLLRIVIAPQLRWQK